MGPEAERERHARINVTCMEVVYALQGEESEDGQGSIRGRAL